MFASRGWMRFALLLNLFGTGMLFFSFQATSSNVRIIRSPDGVTAFCVGDFALVGGSADASSGRRGISMGFTCPDVKDSRAIAVVNIEHPILVTIGFLVLVLGFLLQFLSIPGTKTIVQMRKELKAAVFKEKIAKVSR